MRGKHHGWAALVLLLALGASPTYAGPYLGDWGWCWKEGKQCCKGDYCWLHYWAPTVYRVIYCLHPANIDQFPPGAPVPTTYQLFAFPCRTIPPMPTPPYGDPAGYYGRALLPDAEAGPNEPDATRQKQDSSEKK